MKRKLAILLLFASVFLAFTGCGSGKKEEKGIKMVSECTCYQIDMQGNAIEDYFTLVKPRGQVSIALNGEKGNGSKGAVVSYSSIEEGGWVAYYSGLVIYFPPEVSETSVAVSCTAFHSLNSEDCFTIEEVREYLPWL